MPPLRSWYAAAADRAGVTAIEYALIASIVAIAATSAYIAIGNHLKTIFSNVANGF
jgi:Flp pilus assembly pilin Flp